ncbi:MAG: hypothetical protein JWN70_5107 [Planctomycetaceae bacterium]|nr:hypothetical protein [Planctomycetaceae bacterium]
MAKRFRWNGLITAVAILACANSAAADRPVPRGPLANPPLRQQRVDPALAKVIQDWQQAQSKIRRLDARFSFIRYDKVFAVAEIGDGLVSVDRTGQAFYQVKPRQPKPGETFKDRFPAKPARAERWHFTEHTIYKVDDLARKYESVAIPPEDRPMAIHRSSNPRPAAPPLPEDVTPLSAQRQAEIANPVPDPPAIPEDVLVLTKPYPPTLLDAAFYVLFRMAFSSPSEKTNGEAKPFRFFWFPEMFLAQPFLLDTRPDLLHKNFHIELTKQTPTQTWLELVPLRQQDLANYKKACLILDAADYKLKAMKLVDSTSNIETVYVFSDVRINQPPTPPFGDLGHPDLKGYTRLTHP